MMIRLAPLPTARLIVGLVAGFVVVSSLGAGASMAQEPAYFSGPETAVAETRRLLRAEAWAELARYYDLSGTEIPLESLTSGQFFVHAEPPPVGHPAGFGRYRQPFAPAFSYLSHAAAGGNEVEVTVQVEIDQGGGMTQRGMDTFRLRESARGYRLLPKPPGPASATSPPATPATPR